MGTQALRITAQQVAAELSEVAGASKPEPAPVRTAASREVWPLVIADFKRRAEFGDTPAVTAAVVRDMEERDATGRAKYGTALHTANGRNALVDAYQELLDAAVYLKQRAEELRSEHVNKALNEWPVVSSAYVKTLRLLVALRPVLPDPAPPAEAREAGSPTASDALEALGRG